MAENQALGLLVKDTELQCQLNVTLNLLCQGKSTDGEELDPAA